GDLPNYFNGLGTVTAFNTVTVRSRVDGQLINVSFREGQYVHEGDLLAQVDPRPFEVQLEQAQGQLTKDQAQRKDAEANLERYKLLFKEGVIPQQQLDTQAALVGQFDGAIKSDQSQIDNTKLPAGKLLTIDNQIDPTTGTYKLKSIFNNSDNALFPNQFVNVHLLVDTMRNLTIVPASAIQRGPQGTYVYEVGADNTVKIQTVSVALTTANNVGLSGGVNAGVVVVIDGQDKLQ